MTEVTLREYVERIFDEREKAHQAQMLATQQQLQATAGSLDIRLESMNEFRMQLEKERAGYATLDSLVVLVSRVDRLEESNSKLIGFGAAILAIAGLIVGFLKYGGW